jgi:hypothetical protein
MAFRTEKQMKIKVASLSLSVLAAFAAFSQNPPAAEPSGGVDIALKDHIRGSVPFDPKDNAFSAAARLIKKANDAASNTIGNIGG